MFLRAATSEDHQAIEQLIAESARALGRADYTPEEIEAALHGPWGLDTQLVSDGTYFLVFVSEELAACGGWSFRNTLFGSDAEDSRDDTRLDPSVDAARIRAFFVRPKFARRGLGSLILEHCEKEAALAGFRRTTLGATLPGQRLYATRGYEADQPIDYDLGRGLTMKLIPMTKVLRLGPV